MQSKFCKATGMINQIKIFKINFNQLKPCLCRSQARQSAVLLSRLDLLSENGDSNRCPIVVVEIKRENTCPLNPMYN